jgi:hypothetical protein
LYIDLYQGNFTFNISSTNDYLVEFFYYFVTIWGQKLENFSQQKISNLGKKKKGKILTIHKNAF